MNNKSSLTISMDNNNKVNASPNNNNMNKKRKESWDSKVSCDFAALDSIFDSLLF